VLVVVTFVIGTVTLGLSVLLVAAAIISVPVQEARSRATFIRATEPHYRQLARLAKVAAFRLAVPTPEIYVDQQLPNAYTSGFWRRHWIVVHSCLLDMLTRPLVRKFVTVIFNSWLIRAEYSADPLEARADGSSPPH
jgi:hypothetical protein